MVEGWCGESFRLIWTSIALFSNFPLICTLILPSLLSGQAPPVPKCSINKQRRRPAASEESLAHRRKLHGIMLIPGPRGFIWRAEAGLGERLSRPLCPPLFINQWAKKDRLKKATASQSESQQLLHLHSGAGRTSHNVEKNSSTLSRLFVLCKMVPGWR